MPLIKDGAISEDPWTTLEDDASVPADGDVVVAFARLLEEAQALLQRDGRLGVRVAPDDDVEALAPFADALALVALEFPKFADGRAYSSARLLRERYGFTGELRAVGDVLRDQLFYMVRCGFDAFEVAHDDAVQVFADAMAEQTIVYQPAGDERRPAWTRRRAGIATAAE